MFCYNTSFPQISTKHTLFITFVMEARQTALLGPNLRREFYGDSRAYYDVPTTTGS